MRSCVEQHAPCASEVASDPSPLSLFLDTCSVSALPPVERGKEPVTVLERPDSDDREEELPESFGIAAFRLEPAPHESLSLDMHEAALNTDGGPDFPESAEKGGITVDRCRDGHEAARAEIGEDATENERVLVHPIRTEDDLVRSGIHDRESGGPATFDEGPVDYDAADMREIGRLCRRTIQPVSDDLLNLPRAAPTLGRELSDSVSLNEPAIEPDALSMEDIRGVLPHVRALARPTPPSLRPRRGPSAPLTVTVQTPRTPFFSPYC